MPGTSPPRVSVILPVYNGAWFLSGAIDSILSQTWRDFELLIIDDGSTDDTPAILNEYAARDDRIRVETLPENQGIVAALNRGCALAQGHYLARMDADDVSLPDRLHKQAEVLDRHPEIGVVGASVQWIDEHGTPGRIVHPPASPGVIRWRIHFASPIAHSAVMMRKTVFEQAGGYAEGSAPAEDYDLWQRISTITDLVNLPDVLLLYRVWSGSITSQHGTYANAKAVDVAQRGISTLLGNPVPYEAAEAMRAVMELAPSTWPGESATIRDTAEWLVRLCRVYVAQNRDALSRADAACITEEVAFRLVLLARRVFRIDPLAGVRLVITAVGLYPLVVGRIIGKIGARLPKRRLYSPSTKKELP